MKLCIIIPVFNEEGFIKKSIKSIINQTVRPDRVIYVNDSSTDNTKKLINDFSSKREECKVISNEIANYGIALRNGFKEAKNEMIISFDIDYFSEEFLIEALSLEEKYSAITASKRLKNSEDGRKPVRRIATNLFVLIIRLRKK